MTPIIIIPTIYLIGVLLAENMLLKNNIDPSEHKLKWASWATVLIMLMRNN